MELTTKRSNFWYILPLVLGLGGGILAYFVLRESDSKKAKICLIIGIVISAVWTGAIASSGTSETNSKVIGKWTTTEKNEEQSTEEVKDTSKLVSKEEMDRRLESWDESLKAVEDYKKETSTTEKRLEVERQAERQAELEKQKKNLSQEKLQQIEREKEVIAKAAERATSPNTEAKAIKLVQDFNYNTNSEYTVLEIIQLAILAQYGSQYEDVLKNPSTEIGWMGWMYPKIADPNIYEVIFTLKTYDQDFEPHFIVDMTTGKVSPANPEAELILKQVKTLST